MTEMPLPAIERLGWTDPGAAPDRRVRPVLLQRLPSGWRAISSAALGGGIGPVSWWLNAQVSRSYDRGDPVAHLHEIAAELGLYGRGAGMLTAAEVGHHVTATSDGVQVRATVGLGLPVPAAAPDEVHLRPGDGRSPHRPPRPGTINLLVAVPVPLCDAALVNAVLTATEAKTQALVEAGVPGTGTSSDALCVACPAPPGGGEGVAACGEPYAGPRSRWGARLARAVHRAVAEGTTDWISRHPPGDEHRAWGASWPDRR